MKTSFTLIAVAFLLTANCLLQAYTYAQPGSLDLTFSGDGKVNTPVGSSYDNGESVAIQNDGKIVVAGYASIGSTQDFAVVRYNTDGSLDNTFDTDGKVTTDFGNSNEYAYSVAIQSDGKIVVAGYSDINSNYNFALVRYNTNGSLDNTFDADGKVTTQVGSSDDFGYSVAIQGDGKIVVVGYNYNGSDYDFAVARYNSDGSSDNSFDSDGKLTTAVGSADDEGNSVAVQSDGKIVVAGKSKNGSDYDFALVRYNANGSLDNTFDTDGKLTTAIGSSDDIGRSVNLQADGKIVVAGSSINGSSVDFALVRYNTNGSLDNSFDSDGKVITDFASFDDIGYSAAIQGDGKIVVAGSSYDTNVDFALARYNTDGSLDSIFGANGKVTTPIGLYWEEAYSVAIQADGKIVLAGSMASGVNYDFAVARYNNSCSPAPAPICLVTVDSTSSKNLVVWEKPVTASIDSFRIYRDIVGTFTFIGAVDYDSLSKFVDTTNGINPNITAYKYEISALDTCGNESALSAYHRTIYLQINSGVNLSWNDYEGFSFTYYRIFRDTSGNNIWQLMDSTAAGTTFWTDINPPLNMNNNRYYVEVVHPGGACIATKSSESHNTSRSNVKLGIAQPGSVDEYRVSDSMLDIIPNPNSGIFTIKIQDASLPAEEQFGSQAGYRIQDAEVRVFNILGEKIYSSPIRSFSYSLVDLSNQAPGIYNVQLITKTNIANKKIIIR